VASSPPTLASPSPLIAAKAAIQKLAATLVIVALGPRLRGDERERVAFSAHFLLEFRPVKAAPKG